MIRSLGWPRLTSIRELRSWRRRSPLPHRAQLSPSRFCLISVRGLSFRSQAGADNIATATLYELRNNLGFERKKDLLVEVAKWSGDGLRTNALKMPVN